jgi:hypothetical protein
MNLLAALLVQARTFLRHSTKHEGGYFIRGLELQQLVNALTLMLRYTGIDTDGKNYMKRQRCWRPPSRSILHAVVEGTL